MANPLFDNLEVRQFRAFDYLRIEQLGHVNLILGKNNVGKSTLLEALWLYANLGSPEVIQSILESRDEPGEVRHGRIAEPTVWSLFNGHPPLKNINSSIQIGRVGAPDSALILSIVWLADGKEYTEPQEVGALDGGDGDDRVPALAIKYGPMRRVLRLDDAFEDVCSLWDLQMRSNRDLATPCIFVGPIGLGETDMRSLWEQIVLTDAKSDVIEAMRIIAPETDDFALLGTPTSSIRLRVKGSSDPVPLKSMGDGMNRLFGLGMALACAKDGILLVDEIENGIHWSALPDVWRFVVKVAKRLNVQVFATTHSNDCLRSFQVGTKDDPEVDGVAVRIEKKNGEFGAEIFDESRLAVIVKEAIEIR